MTLAALVTVAGCSMPSGGEDDAQSSTSQGGDGTTGDNAGSDTADNPAGDDSADNAGSTDDGSDAGGGNADACALLTTEEVAASMGKEVKDGAEVPADSGLSACTWEENTSGVPTILTVQILQAGSYETLKGTLDPNEPVRGVGDEAFFATNLTSLIMRKGDAVVQFVAIGGLPDAAAQLDLMKDVAGKAAGRV